MRYNTCPVCGYLQMTSPPEDFYICPCCGTEFGYDDSTRSHLQLRNAWLASGAKWFSNYTKMPFGWNGFRQVAEAGLHSDIHIPSSAVFFTIPLEGTLVLPRTALVR